MKLKAAATLLLLLGLAAHAEEPSANPVAGTPAPPTAPAAAVAPPLASPPPPIVRLPVGGDSGTAASAEAPSAPASGGVVPAVPAGSGPGAPSGAAGSQLGWSNDSVGLRASGAALGRTNRPLETRGSVPRLVRPQRRTVGGFLTGFANLFNPFAPVAEGVATSAEHRYDGQYNPAPLPHGFRDERTHEASALLFSTPIEAEPDLPKAKAPTTTPSP